MVMRFRFLLAILSVCIVPQFGTTASAQEETTPTGGDNRRTTRIVVAVSSRVGRVLTEAESAAVESIVVTAENDSRNAARQAVTVFATSRTVDDVRTEIRTIRRQVRQRARRRISEVVNQDVTLPALMDRMPYAEGSSCELASYDYTVWPDDKMFGVYPPQGEEITRRQYRANLKAACQCGWKDNPTFSCLDATAMNANGTLDILYPPK